MSRIERMIFIGCLVALVAAVSFAGGFAYRHLRIWPSQDIMNLATQIKDYLRFGHWGLPGQFRRADVEAGDPKAVIHDPDRLLPGYRAIMAYDLEMGTYSLKLLDQNLEEIHAWRLSYQELDPVPDTTDEINPHGLEILPDGSVVANYGRGGPLLVRLDACSAPVWVKEGVYHHSLHRDEDGVLWTWHSPEDPNGHFQRIVSIDAGTGEVLREIRMEDVAAASEKNAITLAIPGGFVFSPRESRPPGVAFDIFHANDVEPLSRDMAGAFGMFDAGDLLISLNNLNLVAVLDPASLEIKWARHGPWIRQHDPDFTGDGLIEVYDNAEGRGRSGIVSVDPATGEMAWRFPSGSEAFYSPTQGKHQQLPSGASLVTVPNEGRVLELADTGELILEYNNIAGDGVNARVLNAMWLPPDFFDEVPRCP